MLQKIREGGLQSKHHDNMQSELKVQDGTEEMEDALSKEKEDNPLLKPKKESTHTRHS